MRKSLLMVAVPVSVIGLGLAGLMAVRMTSKAPVDDFAKELAKADAAGIQLAQNQAAKPFSLTETVPETKPEAKPVIKRASSGSKAVRSKAPTVKAAPEAVAADVVEEIPDLTMIAQSTGPTTVEAPVPTMPEPSPATAPAPAQDQGPILRGGSGAGSGSGGGGIGIGTGIGIIFGSVIRGGGVDGDNCDPRGVRRTGGAVNTSVQRPVYGTPSGGGGIRGSVGTGGWGGGSGAAPIGSRRRGGI
jgi:hypothetical protein